MTKAKEFVRKIANALSYIYGYGIMIVLFAGGATFIGYALALIVGGEFATNLCTLIYKQIFPVIIVCSTIIVLIGVLKMYLSGEVALTIEKKRGKSKAKRENKKIKKQTAVAELASTEAYEEQDTEANN